MQLINPQLSHFLREKYTVNTVNKCAYLFATLTSKKYIKKNSNNQLTQKKL